MARREFSRVVAPRAKCFANPCSRYLIVPSKVIKFHQAMEFIQSIVFSIYLKIIIQYY